MKTLIKSLFASLSVILVLTSATGPSFAGEGGRSPVFFNITNYSMIKLSGNVRVCIRQGSQDKIYVESEEEANQVSFKRQGAKLIICSDEVIPVSVYITVKDLKRIDLSDRASIRSMGSLNFSVFQILLKDKALANINLRSQDLYTVVNDKAVLKLSGYSDNHALVKGEFSTLKMENFASANIEYIPASMAALDPEEEDGQAVSIVGIAIKP